MTLNLIYLKYFCDAVNLGGVSAAAKANFVTQSAISQAISKLEKSLGVPLLTHHPNRFRLTHEGHAAFQRASDILKQSSEFQQNFSKECQGTIGKLEFACTYSFALAVVPEILKTFRTDYPKVNVNFYLGKNPDIIHMLKAGSIDFGIVPDEGEVFSGFELKEIYSGHFNLYVSQKVSTAEQKKLGFILTEVDCKETIYFEEAYRKKYRKDPEVFLKVASWEVIANLTDAGLGIGLFPDYVALNKAHCLRPCGIGLKLLKYRICAIYQKGAKLRRSSEIFLANFS